MKKIIGSLLVAVSVIAISCGGGDTKQSTTTVASTEPAVEMPAVDTGTGTAATSENPSYDPNRGAGKFVDVKVGDKLDAGMAAKGEKVAELKCYSCHKLTDEKLVGPGWKGVTSRHHPDWIMNFMTNPDEMIDKDPKAQAMLEICMVRMPDQNIKDNEARELLEFMRKNDGVK